MESQDAVTAPPFGLRERLTAWVRAHPQASTIGALVGLFLISAVVRAVLVSLVHGPRVLIDELGYEQMAKSFAHTGHFEVFGKPGLAYSPLYPVLLSPIYALTSNIGIAYEAAKIENAVLISTAVFPMYAIARFVLPRDRAIGVAALSLIAPLMLYSGFQMAESLAYPLCLFAIWAMLRALRSPSIRNDGIMLVAIGLASAARLQLIVLVPAALTAFLLVELLRARQLRQSWMRALGRGIWQHRLLFGIVAVGFVVALAKTVMNGGSLPLAGRYSNVGTTHASPLRVVELFIQHLAELDFAVGVVPFAAALLAGYALVRFGFPRRQAIFASVALATTFWLLLEVAWDAAAFDATSTHVSGLTDVPRIHERYLIYVMPLFFVALVAALPLIERKIPRRRYFLIAAVAAALPTVIPFHLVINSTTGIDTFALQVLGTVKHGKIVPVGHATLIVLFLSCLFVFGFVRAAARSVPGLAVFMTVLVFLGLSLLEFGRQEPAIKTKVAGLPAHRDWVDRAIPASDGVAVVGGDHVHLIALEETAFWNSSVSRVYYMCTQAFGPSFGEDQLTLDEERGVLRGPAGAIRARYAVVPSRFGVPGRVLAHDKRGKLLLVAPAGGVLRIPDANRSQLRCPSGTKS